ncbi:MAG: hypothetical protein LBU85_04080 [Treponema sp.]|jgi:hypothetical protein|nr:hypothetical protein [Treponema sp.]
MSDDNKEKKRPNAKYRLSHENPNVTEVVHHYNRERRLEKAPQAVRDLYKEPPRRRFGLMQSLIGSKPGAMLFGTIIFLCVLMLLFSYFGMTGDSRELDGNVISVKGTKYEGTVVIEVKKTPRKDKIARHMKAYTGAVDIAVFPGAKSGMKQNQLTADVFFHKIFFTNKQEERYAFTVPFENDELAIVFQTEKKTLSLTIKPLD